MSWESVVEVYVKKEDSPSKKKKAHQMANQKHRSRWKKGKAQALEIKWAWKPSLSLNSSPRCNSAILGSKQRLYLCLGCTSLDSQPTVAHGPYPCSHQHKWGADSLLPITPAPAWETRKDCCSHSWAGSWNYSACPAEAWTPSHFSALSAESWQKAKKTCSVPDITNKLLNKYLHRNNDL